MTDGPCGCDNCNKKDDDMSQMQEINVAVSSSVDETSKIIHSFLNQYFQMENAKIASPFPSVITQLSTSASKDISNHYLKYKSAENIQQAYPAMGVPHCQAISAIISQYLSSINS